MSEPRAGRIAGHGLSLAVREWGDPAAPPLLLVHGGRDIGMSWSQVAERFAARWRVIAPDLRGHGDSDRAADGLYPMEAFVLDLAALAEAVGPAPITLVGHSLGGNIAWRYAAARPDRIARLVVIEGLGSSPERMAQEAAQPPRERLGAWLTEARRRIARAPRPIASIEEGTARIAAAHPRLTPAQARHLAEHGLAPAPGGGFRWKHDPRMAPMPFDLDLATRGLLWAAIRCPVMLVYGAESWASNPAEDGRAAHFPDGQVALIEGAGHWVQLDRAEAFGDRLAGFIGGARGEAGGRPPFREPVDRP